MIAKPDRNLRGLLHLFILAVCACHPGSLKGDTSPPHLRTLTTAREAHDLTLDEAAKSYPVSLRGVATYFDPYLDTRKAILFLHDSTGVIFVGVSLPLPPFIHAGTLLAVKGTSATGDFAPIVTNAQIQVIGESHVPAEAPHVSLTQLLTGKFDGQWVEIEGVVHSFRKYGGNVDLDIATSEGSIVATSLLDTSADYERLVDATVKVHANAGPMYNRNLQLTGARLLLPGLQEVKIEEQAPANPFDLTAIPVNRLLRYTPDIAYRHRVHVRGRVTLQWPGRSLCIQDASYGLCVQTAETTPIPNGALVDLVGFPAVAGVTPTLTDSIFRPAGPGHLVPSLRITAEKAIQGDQDSKLVQIEGKLIGKDHGSKDPTMVLSSGNFIFNVVLPDRPWKHPAPVWEDGSTLRVTGICSVKVEPKKTNGQGFSLPTSFEILLRSPEDVVVIERPSWWTAAHLLPVLAMVLGIALCVLGWVGVLRHRVAEQASVILDQNTTLRKLSFQDALTGIPNRRKFDETLESEYSSARRAMLPVSLLMVDIDHFKALNDTYGHQRGDECLIQVANALVAASVRKTDTVARYGGEEFAIVLPRCGESEAIAIAERMRAAVIDLEIVNSGSPIFGCVSISVGVATTFPASGTESGSLVAVADGALYNSKLNGRNRITPSSAGNMEIRNPAAAVPLRR